MALQEQHAARPRSSENLTAPTSHTKPFQVVRFTLRAFQREAFTDDVRMQMRAVSLWRGGTQSPSVVLQVHSHNA